MENIDDLVVPWVKDVSPYCDDHISYSWENPSNARMMSNENFHPVSQKVVKAIMDIVQKGNLYPHNGFPLRERLAKLDGLKAENVFIANGSSEVIDVITRIFIRPGDEAIIPAPTFSMYEARVKLSGGKPVIILSKEDLTWDVNRILENINSRTRLIFICSPNNPVGSIFPENDLRRILDTCLPTVVDEAYYELEDEPHSMVFLLKEYPNLIVIRTMSKAWGIAGFRIGYSLTSEKITNYLDRIRINFSIGTINMAAAMAALDDNKYFIKQNNETKKLRKELEQDISKLKGPRIYPSSGNFILINLGGLGIKAQEAVDYFLKHNIQVRIMSKMEMGFGFFRVTIGNHNQNKRFVQILQKLLSEINK